MIMLFKENIFFMLESAKGCKIILRVPDVISMINEETGKAAGGLPCSLSDHY